MNFTQQKPVLSKKLNIILSVVLGLMFYGYLIVYSMQNLAYMYNLKRAVVVAFFFVALCVAVPVYFVVKRGVRCPLTVAFIAITTGAALMVRFSLLDYQSSDYVGFLADWIGKLSAAPGLSGWSQQIGDYNMPYLYMLTLIAKLPSVPLYMIKVYSVIFDVILAYYVMQIASLHSKSLNSQMAVFFLTLFVPTFFINSAYWAQCDAIYAAFCAGFIYYALTGRGTLSVIFSAFAFSFKLQTVFILPLMLIFLLLKKIKPLQLIYFPVTFAALLVPALLAGKPLADTVSIYLKQTEAYAKLSLKAPNIFQFFYNYVVNEDGSVTETCLVDFNTFNTAGIMLAGAGVLALLYLLWNVRDKINTEIIVVSAFLLTIGIPYFLPRMHERYFYLAEVFALAVFAFDRHRWFVPFITTVVSLCAYSSFIFADTDILAYFKILPFLYLIVIVLEVRHLFTLINAQKDNVPAGGFLKNENI